MKNLVTKDYPRYNDVNNLYFTEKTENYYHKKDHPIIYTDGSKVEDWVGAAYTVYYYNNFIHDYKITLNLDNSIYQAELLAIKYAINWIVESNHRKVYIFTDNRASYLVLQRAFPANVLIKEIFDKLIENNGKKIVIGWTRAHVGTPGNERADRLAKEAISLEDSDIYEDVKYPISIIKKSIRENCLKEWQIYWKETTKGSDTYRVLKKVDNKFLCWSQVIQYFLTGHGSFPAFLFKIGKRRNDLCTCGAKGDVIHYIFGRCPLMPYFFVFDNSRTVSSNIKRVIFNKDNCGKLCKNYNALNENFSFIRYKF